MKTRLLQRIAAAAAAGLMFLSLSAPVMAEEVSGSIDDAATGKLTSINFRKEGNCIENVPYFVGDDGVIYYSTETSKTPMGDQNELIKKLFGNYDTGPYFKGWEPSGQNTSGFDFKSHWSELGRMIQLNSGLVKISNLTDKGYGIGGGGATANNLKDAENQVMSWNVNGIKDIYKKRALQNETKNQLVVAYVQDYDPIGGIDNNNHACVAVYLYNFRISPLMTNEYLKWAAQNGKAGIKDGTKRNTSAKLGVYNDTPLTKSDQQQISIGIDESSTKEQNGSASWSFTESAKVSAKTKFGPVEATAEVGFSATQAYSSGWKDSSSVSYKDNKSTTQSVTLLPYSGVNLANTVQSGEYKQIIDFPVAISYDVKIVNYGQPNDVKADVIATYEGNPGRGSTDAQSDLYQRYFNHKENQGLKYEGDKYPFSVEDVVSMNAKTAPYFTAAQTAFNGKVSDATSIASGFIAMHPLSSVDTVKGFRELKMKPDQVVACRDIPLKGYLSSQYPDGKGGTAEYPTFNANRGLYEITSGNDVIKITQDGQGRQKIEALKEGKATIIYKIDEKAYNSQEAREHFTKNSELTATAELDVIVNKNAGENPELINKALHELENSGQGWTVDSGYILGDPEGGALTDIQIPTTGLEGMSIEALGNTAGGGYESISIKLNGPKAQDYDVHYRVYVEDLGWMSWTSDNQPAGTSGFDKPITALQVMILEKDMRPTIDDAVTPASYMENTDNSSPSIIFAAMQNAKLNMENAESDE